MVLIIREKMEEKLKPENAVGKKHNLLIDLILKGVALAMGIAVTVLSIMGKLEIPSAMGMLGIGLSCLAISAFPKKED